MTIKSRDLTHNVELMIDSGSEPNLIKIGISKTLANVNNEQILKLIGITNNHVNTLGQVEIEISEIPVLFHW